MKKIVWSLAAIVASLGLLSCAAEQKEAPKVHPAMNLALWTSAQMPAVEGDEWQAFAEFEPQVNQVLMQMKARSAEIVPMGSSYTDPDHLGNYIGDFVPSLTGGSGSGGGGGSASSSLPSSPSVGGSLPTVPSVGGSLPTAPSVGASSLPTTPSLGSMTLSPTPAFLQNHGGGAAASSFAGAFCRFLATALSWTTRCSNVAEAEELYSGVNQVCREIFTTQAAVYLEGISIPASVVSGINCISDAMDADTSCEGQYLEKAFQSCGLVFENE